MIDIMLKPKYFVLFLLLFPALASAQYRGTFSSIGGSGAAGSNTVRFTGGEPVSGVIASSTTYRVTTGFYVPEPITNECNFVGPTIAQLGRLTSSEGSPLTVDVDITDTDNIETAALFYRKGGDPAFVETTMTNSSGTTYSGTIPGDAITTRGAEFFVLAVDVCTNPTRSPSDQDTESAFPVIVSIDAPGRDAAVPQGTQQSNYRLISVPLDLDNKASSSVLADLGAYDDEKWRFWALKSNNSEFEGEEQYNELSSGTSFTPGSAFFLLSADAARYRTNAASTISTVAPFSISLNRGWNFVSSPFDFNIPVSAITRSDGGTINIQAFNGGWTAATTLQPFQGYLFDAGDADDRSMIINPDLSAGKTANKIEEAHIDEPVVSWSIQIDARSDDVFDTNNMIVVGPEASREWDAMDRPEPPVLGDFVSVYFPHREWGRVHRRYEVDARPEPTGGDAWNFEVATGSKRPVTLSFNGLQQVPAHYDVKLIDGITSQQQDIRLNPTYTLTPAGAGQGWPLQLLIGESNYVEDQVESLDILPGKFELDQNYPNPFNPTTSIRYGISEEATVTLQVFNLLGQVVATLVDHELKDAGFHVANWDARYDDGSEAASGLYIYQLHVSSTGGTSAGSVLLTKKMLLIK